MNMYKYETVIIFSTEDKDAIIKSKEKYEKMLSEAPCLLTATDDLGERKLVYEIKGHKTGSYIVYHWWGSPEHMIDFEHQMRINDSVLKFMTVKVDTDEGEYEDEAALRLPEKIESEQPKPDALDVLLGFAKYDHQDGN